jgi:hypothetical protein
VYFLPGRFDLPLAPIVIEKRLEAPGGFADSVLDVRIFSMCVQNRNHPGRFLRILSPLFEPTIYR